MEDSGIDSDQKPVMKNESPKIPGSPVFTTGPTADQVHKKLEKQVLETKKVRNKNSDKSDALSKKSLLSKNSRPKIPTKYNPIPGDEKVLVTWETDSDDDFDIRPPLSREAAREIRQQLIKDGFNLDLSPDDDEDDLDLIPPPKPEHLCGKRCCIIS